MTTAKEAFKLNDGELNRYYDERMSRNTDSKVGFFQLEISKNLGSIKSDQVHIVDVGCGSGKLLHELKTKIPHVEYSGIDISEDLVRMAQSQVLGVRFLVANALESLFRDETVSFFLLSSILHELYSYSGEGFDINGIIRGLNVMRNALIKNGCILIKDPIGPEHKDEYIKGVLNSTHVVINIQENINMPKHQYNLVNGSLIHIDDSIIKYIRQQLIQVVGNLNWTSQLIFEKSQSLIVFLNKIGVSIESILNWEEKIIQYVNGAFKSYIEQICSRPFQIGPLKNRRKRLY